MIGCSSLGSAEDCEGKGKSKDLVVNMHGDKSEWCVWEEQPHGLVLEHIPRLHAWVCVCDACLACV